VYGIDVMPEISISKDKGVIITTRASYSSPHGNGIVKIVAQATESKGVRARFTGPYDHTDLTPAELRLLASQLEVLADAIEEAETQRKRAEALERLKSPASEATG
jgi:hypothetical protein